MFNDLTFPCKGVPYTEHQRQRQLWSFDASVDDWKWNWDWFWNVTMHSNGILPLPLTLEAWCVCALTLAVFVLWCVSMEKPWWYHRHSYVFVVTLNSLILLIQLHIIIHGRCILSATSCLWVKVLVRYHLKPRLWFIHTARDQDQDREREKMGFYLTLCTVHTSHYTGTGNDGFLYYTMYCTH